MVILRELSDESGSSPTSPSLNPRVQGFVPKFWFSSSSDESDSDSSRSSDCVIISPSSFTGKELVEYRPVEDEEEVVVDPVGEDELVTTVNMVEPHYFYMYGTVIQTFNLWFPLTQFEGDVLRVLNVAPVQLHPNTWGFIKAFEGRLLSLSSQPNRGLFTLYASNFKNYQDTFFRLRCGPKLPDLMYDSKGNRLFPFYWSDNPTLIMGVREEMLTPFERETVQFLDSFLILDIKDVLRRENDAKSTLSFLKRMKRVPDEEWLAYLAKSKQKKLTPDAHVDPSVQLIIDADGSKGAKRKRKLEGSRVTIKVPRKEGESSGADGDVLPPPRVVTRASRSSTATVPDVGVAGDALNEAGVTDKKIEGGKLVPR
ncbi:hypothetical protein TSUD_27050 [Trifolium subterraneum]|uniref:Uncharacterized protein n=1 Tax=Trifolium subterraneum TaxID=3900 RepID=A0A2Z6LXE0_TRISU|nr:hypothetical protein TSUD_27050 [Trifolium subterraneum]